MSTRDLVAQIKLKDQGFKRGLDDANRSLSNMERGVGHLSKSLSQFKYLIGGIGLLVGGYGVKQLAGSFLNAARTAENYQVRLRVLLGSVEEGNRLFKNMSEYAGKVPFELEQIMGAATQLSGVMRGGVDEIGKWMPLIGDLAAVSGLSIQQTTEQVVRMYSAGAASADLFRERGITAMLGFQSGVKYSAEETRAQLIRAWEDPASKFRGATGEMAKTWDGLMSMVKDTWFQLRKNIMDAGVFDELKKALSDVHIATKNWVESNKDLIAIKVPEYVERVKSVLSSIWTIVSYDPAILEWGLVGLAIGGKKWAVLAGGVAHMATWAENLGKALGMVAGGILDIKDVAGSNFQQLEDLVKMGESIMSFREGGSVYRGKIPSRDAPVRPNILMPPSAQDMKILEADIKLAEQWQKEAYASLGIEEINQSERLENELVKREKMEKDSAAERLKMYKKLGEDEEKIWNAQIKDYKKHTEEMGRTVRDFAQNANWTLGEFFFDAMSNDLKSFGDYWEAFWTRMKNSLARTFADMATEWAMGGIKNLLLGGPGGGGGILGSLAGGVGSWLGSGASGIAKSIGGFIGKLFHEGGIVGDIAGMKAFHDLQSDEVVGVLQRGEMVLTRDQVARLLGGGVGEPGVVGPEGAQMTMGTFAATIGNLGLGMATGGLTTIASGIANAISNEVFGQNLSDVIGSALGLGGLDSIGDVGGPGADPGVVGFATGGIVHRDQVARVHQGEGVFTPEQMNRLSPMSGQPINVTVPVYIDGRMVSETVYSGIYDASKRKQVTLHERSIEGFTSTVGLDI